MARGGRRKGNGVKKGSIRPDFCDYLTAKEIKDTVLWVKENYKTDSQLKTWYLDHIFGKAVQPLGNDGDKPFLIKGVDILVRE